MKILMAVTSNLESDQRVNKVASTLYNEGNDVKVIGVNKASASTYIKQYKTERLSLFFNSGKLFYIEYNFRLLLKYLFADYDVAWANDTDVLFPCTFAAKLRGKKVVMDMHEFFPELPEVVDRKLVQKVWTKVEDMFIPKVDRLMTVCQSIAEHYSAKYNKEIAVVRNIPNYKPYEGRNERISDVYPQIPKGKKIILYQGAVNIGRGIEWVIDAMPYVREDAVFVVAGKGELYEELKTRASDRVVFLGHIPYEKLRELTLSAGIGVCLLEAKGLSYYYSLPNRVFDLISAHVPILATDFPEIRRIVEHYESGTLISDYSPKNLANEINCLLSAEINHEKFERAAKELNWENEEKKIKEIVNGI